MALLLASLIVVAALALVAYPLLRRGEAPWQEEAQASAMRNLLDQRDTLYRVIQQLDFDKELGNIEEEDHRTMRSRYVRRAAAILREIDSRERDLEEEVDREVAALLHTRGGRAQTGERPGGLR